MCDVCEEKIAFIIYLYIYLLPDCYMLIKIIKTLVIQHLIGCVNRINVLY